MQHPGSRRAALQPAMCTQSKVQEQMACSARAHFAQCGEKLLQQTPAWYQRHALLADAGCHHHGVWHAGLGVLWHLPAKPSLLMTWCPVAGAALLLAAYRCLAGDWEPCGCCSAHRPACTSLLGSPGVLSEPSRSAAACCITCSDAVTRCPDQPHMIEHRCGMNALPIHSCHLQCQVVKFDSCMPTPVTKAVRCRQGSIRTLCIVATLPLL